MSTRYNVSHNSLWEYLALLLHNSRESQFDEEQFNKSMTILGRVYEAIERKDGLVDPHALLDEATFQYEDFFIRGLAHPRFACSWFGSGDSRCNESMFRSIFTKYGRCLVFNSYQNGTGKLLQLKEGPANGFSAILDVHPQECCGNLIS